MAMFEFSETYNLQNLEKYTSKTICIDIILINFPKSLKHTQTIETGLPDFSKQALTVLKTRFPRLKSNIVNYRDYQCFVNDCFQSELLQEKNGSGSGIINFKVLQYKLQRVVVKHISKEICFG